MIDVAKVRSALAAAKGEVQNAVTAAVKAGEKNPRALNGIGPLVKVNALLDKATERLDEAVERSAPKPEKAKEEKGKDAKK